MDFKNIDIIDIECFGFSAPMKKSWLAQLRIAGDFASIQDKKNFEKDLKANIESSYYRLCGITFKDLDTDFEYYASFVNGWKKWDLELMSSKSGDVDVEDKKKFFASEEAKKIAKRAAKYIADAVKAYDKSIKQQIESGSMLSVDETKLESVIKWASDISLMKAFESLTYSTKTFS